MGIAVTEIVPWLAFLGAGASVTAVIKYYQDRARAREDRAKAEQELSDQIKSVERDVVAIREEIDEVRDSFREKISEVHNAATAATARAQLARDELHQAQLALPDKYVAAREMAAVVASVDKLGAEVRGMSGRLDLIMQRIGSSQ